MIRARCKSRRRLSLASAALLAACSVAPVGVDRVSPQDTQRQRTSNVISTGDVSPDTRIVLQRLGMWKLWKTDPQTAFAALHRIALGDPDNADDLFALAEMSFRQAESNNAQAYSLAAVIYAFAFLFPSDPNHVPNALDPRVRTATDIYNQSLTSAFAAPDRSRVVLRSGNFALPFGSIEIAFDSASAKWHDHWLSNFTPAERIAR
jgi:hypothetical protein